MKYSNNPTDWGFNIYQDQYLTSIQLYPDGPYMCDQLGGHNLPRPIASLLKSVGVYTNSELAESCFEFNNENVNVQDVTDKLIELGFNYIPE